MRIRLLSVGMLALFVSVQPARADLINLGNGMIYDTVQDLTWLQDMAYVRTSGYDADGRLTYAQASSWTDSVVFGGYDDWRLPTMQAVGVGPRSNDEISGLMGQLGGNWDDPWWPIGEYDYRMPTSWGPFLPPTRVRPADVTAFWVAPPVGPTDCPDSYPNCYVWLDWFAIDLAPFHWSTPDRPGPTALAVRNGLARVPEPSTVLVMSLGAAMFGVLRRRRRAEA